MITAISQHLHARSATLLVSLETRLGHILVGWLVVAGLASALRIGFSLPRGGIEISSVLPYLLVVLAPLVTARLALRWFQDGDAIAQPATRLALIGKWRNVSLAEARSHHLYGTSGIMVSLMMGMLVNIAIRGAEYFTAMPPIPALAPHWLLSLRLALTLDVVLFTSLYMVAFVAALRRAPLFPFLLAAIWVADLAMQCLIAQTLGNEALPAGVGISLHDLLSGNIKKVLISITLWLPYLLLSKRVNVTYRLRVPH